MFNVFVSAEYYGYAQPLLDTGKWQLVYDIDQTDVVMFAGGADIQPMLYKQPMGRYTYCSHAEIKSKSLTITMQSWLAFLWLVSAVVCSC